MNDNYLMFNGNKIPLSEETIKNIKDSIDNKKITYSDVAKKLFKSKKIFFINNSGYVVAESDKRGKFMSYSNNSQTREQLESILALNKLANVAKDLNDGWVPNWLNSKLNHYIYLDDSMRFQEMLIGAAVNYRQSSIYFRTKELAEQAIEILGEDVIRKALTLNHFIMEELTKEEKIDILKRIKNNVQDMIDYNALSSNKKQTFICKQFEMMYNDIYKIDDDSVRMDVVFPELYNGIIDYLYDRHTNRMEMKENKKEITSSFLVDSPSIVSYMKNKYDDETLNINYKDLLLLFRIHFLEDLIETLK